MHKVTIFKRPLIIPRPLPGRTPKRNSTDPSEQALDESLRRTRSVIFDYALANEFTHFATFTFNPKKIDRYSWESVSNTMKYWLNRQKKTSPDFSYLAVPEFHKDGAIHFHALFKGYAPDLKRTNVIQNGQRVYNITGFTSGFTNVKELDSDYSKAAAYVTKYLTKDNIVSFNKRRYWVSKNLIKPIKRYDPLDQLGLLPYINSENLTFESEDHHLEVYQFTVSPGLNRLYRFFQPDSTLAQQDSVCQSQQPKPPSLPLQLALDNILQRIKPPPYIH